MPYWLINLLVVPNRVIVNLNAGIGLSLGYKMSFSRDCKLMLEFASGTEQMLPCISLSTQIEIFMT